MRSNLHLLLLQLSWMLFLLMSNGRSHSTDEIELGCGGGGGDDCDDDDQIPSAVAPQSPPQMTSDQWQARQRQKHKRLYDIQREIMDRLGLRRRPNVTSSNGNNMTKEDIQRYAEILQQADREINEKLVDENEFYAKRYKTVLPACSTPRNSDRTSWEDGSAFRIFFAVESAADAARQRQTKVSLARLRIMKRKSTNRNYGDKRGSRSDGSRSTINGDEFTVKVYAYTRPVKKNKKDGKKLINSATFRWNEPPTSGSTSGFASSVWLSIDVKNAVDDWIKRPNRNFGFELTVENENNETVDPFEIFEKLNCSLPMPTSPIFLHFPVSEFEEGTGTYREMTSHPAVLLDTITIDVPMTSSKQRRHHPSSSSHRNRRNIVNGSATTRTRSGCKMKKVVFTFEELGLSDIIISPESFTTGICTGSCSSSPYGSYLSSCAGEMTKETAAKIAKFGSNVCCVSTHRRDLSVVYLSEEGGDFLLASIKDYIIAECGCRD